MSLVFRVVRSLTSSKETSATSCLHFPLSMVSRYLQSFGGRPSNKQIKTTLNELVDSCASIFTDLRCKTEPAWSQNIAAKSLFHFCLHKAVQRTLQALENCTIKSLTPYQSKEWYSVLNGKDVLLSLPTGYGKSLIYHLAPSLSKQLGIQVC